VVLNLIMNNSISWFLSDLEKIPKNNLKVFSTFACGGGSSMGYKLAGCNVIGANDIDPKMAYHYRLNLNPKYYFLCPVKRLLEKDLPEELFNLDILDGSPPCSTFSMAGSREQSWSKEKYFREGQQKQVLSDLFFDYLDLVNHLKPKVVIAENAKGMILGRAKGYTKLVMERFSKIGYKPQLFLVNAAQCGVPQNRERLFFCAVRKDLKVSKLRLTFKSPRITAREATKDLTLTEKEKKDTAFKYKQDRNLWPYTKPGTSYEYTLITLGKKGSYFNNKKLDGDKPSNTLTAVSSSFTHWEEPRYLTFREWKRLGSFPDDYKAKTDNIGRYIVGMSVPPKMIEKIVKQIIDQWLFLN